MREERWGLFEKSPPNPAKTFLEFLSAAPGRELPGAFVFNRQRKGYARLSKKAKQLKSS